MPDLSFLIKVARDNNLTWHGRVEQLESGQVATFHDSMEMVRYLYQILEEDNPSQHSDRLRTWKDQDAG